MLKNSNYIVLQVEFNDDYSIEYIKFSSFKEAQRCYFSNLSQLKLLNIMYKDENNNCINVDKYTHVNQKEVDL